MRTRNIKNFAEKRNVAARRLRHRLRQSSSRGAILLCNDHKVLNIMTRFLRRIIRHAVAS